VPVGLLTRLGQRLQEILEVNVIQEDILTPVTPAHDVVKSPSQSQSRLRPGETVEEVVHQPILGARFCNAFARKPLIIEEFTFAAPDPNRVADCQARMVLGIIGHASGWMNWLRPGLEDPAHPQAGCPPVVQSPGLARAGGFC
jgi:hypothetical protein